MAGYSFNVLAFSVNNIYAKINNNLNFKCFFHGANNTLGKLTTVVVIWFEIVNILHNINIGCHFKINARNKNKTLKH